MLISPFHKQNKMAEEVEEESTSFKLFGTVIQKGDGESREGEAVVRTASEHLAAEEAAARVAAALPCPRCKSTETKFCYFNNYNINQPRHFCKACHRYWTAGGTLRNVPHRVGRRRGRPGQRRGAAHATAAAAAAACVVDYSSPGCSDGTATERWLLGKEVPGDS